MLKYNWIIYAIGFLAQGFFSARILSQWYKSEKAKALVSPLSYWIFSLAGSYLMFVYGWCRDDFSIILGQLISYYIYIWNLNVKGLWHKLNILIRIILVATPVAALVMVFNDAASFLDSFLKNDNIPLGLVIFGSFGQVVFTLRFVYQLLYSHKKKESALPIGFWLISLLGSGIIITYGIIRKDPVLILGQSFGFVVYVRNVVIGTRANKRETKV
jgi:lipid-A-disaccharide synthase-like uncharacterized protein